MSKYIIELFDGVQVLTGVGASPSGTVWSKSYDVDELEELNSDYINEHFSELQDEAYQKGINDGSLDVKQRVEGAYQSGLEDAWEAARKIVGDTDLGGMALSTLDEIFGTRNYDCIMRYNTSQEAIDKIKAYEDKQKDRIEVGDEVIWKTDNIKLIVTSMYEVGSINWCDGVAQDGKVYSTLIENNQKTGKHYDIASILEAMRTHD